MLQPGPSTKLKSLQEMNLIDEVPIFIEFQQKDYAYGTTGVTRKCEELYTVVETRENPKRLFFSCIAFLRFFNKRRRSEHPRYEGHHYFNVDRVELMEFVGKYNPEEEEEKSQHDAVDDLHHDGIELLTTSDQQIRLNNDRLELAHEQQDENHAMSNKSYTAVLQDDSKPEEDPMQSATFEESEFVGKCRYNVCD